jgi:DNA-directed RNA polymerase subunit RPC12/RpoP
VPDGQTGGVEIEQQAGQEVACPHCKKTFTAPLLAGGPARYRGYKCPHCRLFVPERPDADEPLSRESES